MGIIMLYFQSIGEAEAVFKALSTPMRLKIMEMIYEDDTLSMNDLAEALGLTNGAISIHVSKLEEAGLVNDVLCGKVYLKLMKSTEPSPKM